MVKEKFIDEMEFLDKDVIKMAEEYQAIMDMPHIDSLQSVLDIIKCRIRNRIKIRAYRKKKELLKQKVVCC